MFAATSGSSVATAATVGTVALPQARRFGYNERLFLGTLAAGGTLGILIPPSINMIIYAVLTNTSVPKLYLAGMHARAGPRRLLFMLTVVVLCLARPAWGGKRMVATWGERIAGLVHLLPPLGDLPGRGRLDLRRHRHAHRGGVARRGGGARPRLVEGQADARRCCARRSKARCARRRW